MIINQQKSIQIPLFLIVFLCFANTISFAQNSFDQGEQFFKQKNYKEAKLVFEKLLATTPNHSKAKEYVADIAFVQKKWDKAISLYKSLVEAKPDNANYNFKYAGALGVKALKVNKIKASFYIADIKKHLKKAARLDKNHIKSRWALVDLYLQLPSFFGGGEETAQKYAEELEQIKETDGILSKGYIAESKTNQKLAKYYYSQINKQDYPYCKNRIKMLNRFKNSENQKTLFFEL